MGLLFDDKKFAELEDKVAKFLGKQNAKITELTDKTTKLENKLATLDKENAELRSQVVKIDFEHKKIIKLLKEHLFKLPVNSVLAKLGL